jgi:hypothetical protein
MAIDEILELRASIIDQLDRMVELVRHSQAGYKAALTKGPDGRSAAAIKAATTRSLRDEAVPDAVVKSKNE